MCVFFTKKSSNCDPISFRFVLSRLAPQKRISLEIGGSPLTVSRSAMAMTPREVTCCYCPVCDKNFQPRGGLEEAPSAVLAHVSAMRDPAHTKFHTALYSSPMMTAASRRGKTKKNKTLAELRALCRKEHRVMCPEMCDERFTNAQVALEQFVRARRIKWQSRLCGSLQGAVQKVLWPHHFLHPDRLALGHRKEKSKPRHVRDSEHTVHGFAKAGGDAKGVTRLRLKNTHPGGKDDERALNLQNSKKQTAGSGNLVPAFLYWRHEEQQERALRQTVQKHTDVYDDATDEWILVEDGAHYADCSQIDQDGDSSMSDIDSWHFAEEILSGEDEMEGEVPSAFIQSDDVDATNLIESCHLEPLGPYARALLKDDVELLKEAVSVSRTQPLQRTGSLKRKWSNCSFSKGRRERKDLPPVAWPADPLKLDRERALIRSWKRDGKTCKRGKSRELLQRKAAVRGKLEQEEDFEFLASLMAQPR